MRFEIVTSLTSGESYLVDASGELGARGPLDARLLDAPPDALVYGHGDIPMYGWDEAPDWTLDRAESKVVREFECS